MITKDSIETAYSFLHQKQRIYVHSTLEPGTKEAFNGYVACLHQLYLMGAAMQLKRMGYHMTKMN